MREDPIADIEPDISGKMLNIRSWSSERLDTSELRMSVIPSDMVAVLTDRNREREAD